MGRGRKSSRNSVLCGLILLGFTTAGFSQDSHSYLWQSDFGIKIPSGPGWSHLVKVANRGLLLERVDGNKVSGQENLYFQLDYFTRYQRPEQNSSFSIGLRYRFREMFNPDKEDEIRFIEQFGYTSSASDLEFSHRARFEQRFRGETIYRLRYEFGISRTLSDFFSLEISTEALYGVSPQVRPEAEQRFDLKLENTTFRNLGLKIGVEYRMENYLEDLAHELLFFSGATLKL